MPDLSERATSRALLEQRSGGLAHRRRLPERGPTRHPQRGEGSSFGERLEFVGAQLGAAFEVLEIGERPDRPFGFDRLAALLPQPAHIAQPEANRAAGDRGLRTARSFAALRTTRARDVPLPVILSEAKDRAFRAFPRPPVLLPGALPLRMIHIDRAHLDAVPFGVLDQRRGVVEAHRPGVQQAGGEGGRVVAAQPGRGVGDEREARGVRFGEAVERERGDRLHDLILRLAATMPRSVIPERRRSSILIMRSLERLKPIARRSSSASPPVNPATVIAIFRSCSWKSGTPRVRFKTGRLGCG